MSEISHGCAVCPPYIRIIGQGAKYRVWKCQKFYGDSAPEKGRFFAQVMHRLCTTLCTSYAQAVNRETDRLCTSNAQGCTQVMHKILTGLCTGYKQVFLPCFVVREHVQKTRASTDTQKTHVKRTDNGKTRKNTARKESVLKTALSHVTRQIIEVLRTCTRTRQADTERHGQKARAKTCINFMLTLLHYCEIMDIGKVHLHLLIFDM